jgi:NitT/TauT family transport system substrate-binding protein
MLKKLSLSIALASSLVLIGCSKSDPVSEEASVALSAPITIAYSEWPGSLAWEIAKSKGWFKEAGLNVNLEWFSDYNASIQAFLAGKIDGASVANGDNFMLSSQGVNGNIILVNSMSTGNDIIIAKPGIKSLADLKGKTIAFEQGLVSELFFNTAMENENLNPKDVKVVNAVTQELSQVFAAPNIDAIALWQPFGLQALKAVPGSSIIYDSTKTPGLIYDVLSVNLPNVERRKDDWKKLILVWDKVVHYLDDPATRADGIQIMADRAEVDAKDLEKLMAGTTLLDLKENQRVFQKGEGLDSLYGSSYNVNNFNIKIGIYKESPVVENTIYPSLVNEAKP